ncbi:ABC transporter substrate-binding protein [Pseudonocardia sp. DSM 110487]|uniref:ABC transporter substrate-binding protein n=1 Tax=Pseudonocardia sp. DSM 110487 TaxID=2865833 RepID=UPI001C6956EA|nr:ABC transporter substrate-binding protein [Pseudonocardia sp. DSM 110487]QYN33537.1 ABC transporter substrate-binding protein [Pseudonocardia sp. DSM 110487]
MANYLIKAIAVAAVAATVLSACSGRSTAPADDAGGTGDIVIRASYPLSGSLSSAGASAAGATAYFEAVNAAGGVNGRQIDFQVADDAFDPARLVSNNRQFVERDRAAIVINFGGISVAARPPLNAARVAQIVQGGERELGDVTGFPYSRAFVPDIAWEGELQGRYITENMPGAVVGFLGFNNDFAASQLAGLAAAGIQPVRTITLPPGQGDVASQVTELEAAGVNVLVTTIGPPTMGALLSYMGQINYKPTTFIGSPYADFASTVNPAGAQNVTGALSYQWFTDPQNPAVHDDPALVQYRADMARFAPEADANQSFTITGYGLAAAIVEALRNAGDVSSDSFLAAWDSLSQVQNPMLINDATLTGDANGRVVHEYQLHEFDGTSWVPRGGIVDVTKVGIVS